MTAEVLAPRDVPTTLNYCASTTTDGQSPYYSDTPEGVPRSNMLTDNRAVVIHDVRGREALFGLDVSGFMFAKCPSVENDFVDEEKVQTVYYAQCEEILKQYTGAKRVAIFNHTVRRSPNAQTALKAQDPAVGIVSSIAGCPLIIPCPPQYAVHVDKMNPTHEQTLKDRLGDDAERLMNGRYRIINLWR